MYRYNNQLISPSRPQIMGILNATPDSFYGASRVSSGSDLRKRLDIMLADGVDLIDLGAFSTRPGAEDISVDEEIKRLTAALEVIRKHYPELLVSVDTFRSSVVRHVVKEFKVGIINDIGGGSLDELMFSTIADLGVTYVLMHSKGTPQTMQNMCSYDNVVADVLNSLQKKVKQLHLLGVTDVIVDPGFGFAKTLEQNFELMKQLSVFKQLNTTLLVGVSRKSMVYKTLNCTPEEALNGTTVLHTFALMQGADILRVHDVKAAKEAIVVYEALK
jgi:dihydropteroate synthase